MLVGGGSGERGGARKELLQASSDFGKTFAIGFLIVGGEGDQRTVNEEHHTGLTGARGAVTRDNAGSNGFHFLRLFGSKKLEFLRARRGGSLAGVLGGSEDGRPMGRGPGGAESRKTA